MCQGGRGGEADARRGCSHPGLAGRAVEEGGIGSSPAEFLSRGSSAELHLLSTAPLNGSELRVKYLLQLLPPCPNHSSSVKYNFVALNIAQIYSSSCSFRLLVAGCWGEQPGAARGCRREQLWNQYFRGMDLCQTQDV